MFLIRKIRMRPINNRSVHHHGNHIVQDRFSKHKAEQIIVSVQVVEHCEYGYRISGADEGSECPTFFKGQGALGYTRYMTECVNQHGGAEDCDECAQESEIEDCTDVSEEVGAFLHVVAPVKYDWRKEKNQEKIGEYICEMINICLVTCVSE